MKKWVMEVRGVVWVCSTSKCASEKTKILRFRLGVYRRKYFLASVTNSSEGNLLAADFTEPSLFLIIKCGNCLKKGLCPPAVEAILTLTFCWGFKYLTSDTQAILKTKPWNFCSYLGFYPIHYDSVVLNQNTFVGLCHMQHIACILRHLCQLCFFFMEKLPV